MNLCQFLINLAKIVHWLSTPKEQQKSFSMTDVKILNHNTLQLKMFFLTSSA